MLRLIATALSTDKTTTTFQEELRKAISVENPQFLQVSAVYVGTISGAVTGVVVIHELYKLWDNMNQRQDQHFVNTTFGKVLFIDYFDTIMLFFCISVTNTWYSQRKDRVHFWSSIHDTPTGDVGFKAPDLPSKN